MGIYPVCATGQAMVTSVIFPATGLFGAGFWAAKGEGWLQEAAGSKGRLRGGWGQRAWGNA